MDEKNKQPEGQNKQNDRLHNRKFLAFYIVALFCVVLVLIILSYLAQVHSKDQLSQLNQQLGEQTTVAQGAQERADQLQQQYEQLQEQYDQLESQLQSTLEGEQELSDTLYQKERQLQALAVFWKIEQAYLTGDETECRRLIDYLELMWADALTGDALDEYERICEDIGYQP